jgi:transcriptional regulator of aroF, aroG, tyrA and aromatic amino acid transport
LEDIPLLADHFLFQLASKLNKSTRTLSRAALDKLFRHHWPGNVRELKNVDERAAILSKGGSIDVASILFSHELGAFGAGAVQGAACKHVERCNLKELIAAYEKNLIANVLGQCRSKRQAAKRLNISHTALINKVNKYKLAVETK